MSLIYRFYDLISKDDKNGLYRCKTCVSMGKKNTDKSSSLFANSNLVKHLETAGHEEALSEFNRLTEQNKTPVNNKKRRLYDSPNITPTNLLTSGSIAVQNKFNISGQTQRERLIKLNKMIVKCMLPISIVESAGFKEYIQYIDPSFTMPNRETIKRSSLPYLVQEVQVKIKNILINIEFPNVSTDGWTDASMRPYNGYICQGIDNNWDLHTICIGFEYL